MSDVTGYEIIRFITGQPIRDSDPFDPAWAEVLGKLPPWRRYFGLRCERCEAEATRKVLTYPTNARYSVLAVFACDTHASEILRGRTSTTWPPPTAPPPNS